MDFMNAMYETLESKKIGIFESPTETGKTLSLICSSMTWLRDHKRKYFQGDNHDFDDDQDNDEPEWVKENYRSMVKKEKESQLRQYEEKLAAIREKEKLEKASVLRKVIPGNNYKRVRNTADNNDKGNSEDNVYIPDDYDSDGSENVVTTSKSTGMSSGLEALLKKFDEATGVKPVDEDITYEESTKIIFTSRTHSQLTQFTGQLKLPKFTSSLSNFDTDFERVKEVSMGSRKQLCIHPKVSKMNSVNLMNEACKELRTGSEAEKCQFYMNEDLAKKVKSRDFRDRALAGIRDIEELALLGKETEVCPYYGIRKALPMSEVIAVPYQLLIQESARKTIELPIKDSIIIIDEAHNLLDVIQSLYSLSVSSSDITRAKSGLHTYKTKFYKRLSWSNQVYLSQVVKAVDSLDAFILQASIKDQRKVSPGVELKQSDIFRGTTSDLINMHKLQKYLDKSKLVFKVETYIEMLEKEAAKKEINVVRKNNFSKEKSTSTPVLSKVINFLLSITNPSSEGKVFYDRDEKKELSLKYMLLDPSEKFRNIVDEAKCVILAGGTMEPVDDYLKYLFPYLSKPDIKLFSCSHIIPKENLSVYTIGNGPSKEEFEFKFGRRDSEVMIDDLGKSIVNLANFIPAGLVVFFPSYSYMDQICTRWKIKGTNDVSLWERLESKKKIFSEPKTESVEEVLGEYSAEISNPVKRGAILLSVVGGKMSEGINFSDDLARGVIMVGLPFPNAFSAELVARRKFIEKTIIEKGGSNSDALQAARSFYENICMRAVNQSIGRAIRHANDYAVIVLFDRRYGQINIRKKLPAWIQNSISPVVDKEDNHKLGEVIRGVSLFFRSKGKKEEDV
ncbi:ATP-dependent RNA helicase CHL1 [Nadsonia fulvescens var. elongata DSM 6958]|uniref:ATP-dependent DNA helicase CHL1 n=1 Tax=Nadsonia fulvescens var. elongata DSM 6958 TaxID=857566 RepID=A0A1E3PRD8_9ASCO|nr:ATP-dependent RNA helicase CHL1 [Nadsonia fulvescens var. elongata DSM 6958]